MWSDAESKESDDESAQGPNLAPGTPPGRQGGQAESVIGRGMVEFNLFCESKAEWRLLDATSVLSLTMQHA